MAKGIAEMLAGKMAPEAEPEEEVEGDAMGLDAAANQLISAVQSKDTAGVVESLRNAFTILQAEPLEEETLEDEMEP